MFEIEKANSYIDGMSKMSFHLREHALKFANSWAAKALDKAKSGKDFKEVETLLNRLDKISTLEGKK